MVQGLGFKVQESGFRVQGAGCRVFSYDLTLASALLGLQQRIPLLRRILLKLEGLGLRRCVKQLRYKLLYI